MCKKRDKKEKREDWVLELKRHTLSDRGFPSFVGVPVRGGGLGSRPKKMYGERLGDGVEYH